MSPVGLCPCLAYFSFALNRILLVLAQCWRKRSRGQPRPLFAVQAALVAEIKEHDALQSATHTVCETLEVEGV